MIVEWGDARVVAIRDLLLFAGCDLHMARTGVTPASPDRPPLVLRAALRESDDVNPPPVMTVVDVLPAVPGAPVQHCQFRFFAPLRPVGHRLDPAGLPSVDPVSGVVTAPELGVYLFQAIFAEHVLVGRLQVHDRFLGWWFGNSSITTAVDPAIAHAQPSIYALFSDDAGVGTDRVGDVTGHGYVTLTSNAPGIVTPGPHGRLQGHAEGTAVVTGTFAALGSASIQVTAVNYGKLRRTLEPVRVGNATKPTEAHNIIFLAEGFTKQPADRERFDEIVTKVVDDLFDAGRHEPYPMLKDGFNVWKVFEPSSDRALTCAYPVTTQDIALPSDATIDKGAPIPLGRPTAASKRAMYTVEELVRIVGLPARGEGRDLAALVALWQQQSLTDPAGPGGQLQPAKIDPDLIAAWKGQRVDALLEARDTFFGLQLGRRLGDRVSTIGAAPLPVDGPPGPRPNALATFIEQLYQFYNTGATRSFVPDRRRHPPQLMRHTNNDNVGYAIMRYLDQLEWAARPGHPVGSEFVPNHVLFKRSRGLVAVIGNDDLIGGTNFGERTVTAQTMNSRTTVPFSLQATATTVVMRRTPPTEVALDLDDVIRTVAHEFGHSFNLADEYEEHPGPPPFALSTVDFTADNVSRLGAVFLHGTAAGATVTGTDGTVDPAKLKWATLPRMALSSRLLTSSEPFAGGVKVTIDKRGIGAWIEARDQNLRPSLRNVNVTVAGQQLPLATGPAQLLTNLTIAGIDEAAGTILLSGAAGAVPFAPGSVLFVPKLATPAGPPELVLKERVRAHLAAVLQRPLNRDPNTAIVNQDADEPVDIPNFNLPCHPYRLIGVYEGAVAATQSAYRPAGACKMRQSGSEFCHVCKWLIVNRVDPGLHAQLDKHYPEAKKHG